jgi:hypothetical protein
MDTNGSDTGLMRMELKGLAVDSICCNGVCGPLPNFKRMLSVRFKEFVHTMETVESEQGQDVTHSIMDCK